MTVGEQAVEAEGVGVDGLAHVGDAAGAQDVERERAQAGEDAGPAPDPAGVLPPDAVTYVMRPVLDPPVGPDRAPERLRRQCDLADVVGDLAAGPPQAGAGVLAPGEAGARGGAAAPPPPLRREPSGDREDLDAPVLLTAVPTAVGRRVPVEGVLL